MNKLATVIKGKHMRILSIMFVVVLVIPALITIFTYGYHFSNRIYHDNDYFEYLQGETPSFVREEVSFLSNEGQTLRGAFYTDETSQTPKGLIVWVHGMGVNHNNYLGEIQWLTNQGYVVFSYDSTGVQASDGASLKGMSQAPIDLQYALTHLLEINAYPDIPHILVGHSWGGFAVCAVAQLGLPYEVDGIVSLAGFWKNVNAVLDIARPYTGDVIDLLYPYLTLYERIRYGELAEINGIDGLQATDAKVLIIHSQDDAVIQFDSNYMIYQEAFQGDERFTFASYTDAGHKLTINQDAYDRIHDIMHHQMELEATSQAYQMLNEERLGLIKDYNLDVMHDILAFCEGVERLP